MEDRTHDRRRNAGDLGPGPRSSPVNVLILTVVGVLLATAAATVVLGPDYDDATPHGQVLGALQRVARMEEAHYRRERRFTPQVELADSVVAEGVKVTVIRGDSTGWEAVVSHPMGLMCTQEGRAERGQPVMEEPVCYRPQ